MKSNPIYLGCCALVIAAFVSLGGVAADKPFLHPLFSEHMVLQRDIPVPIWGWTKPGAQVTVTFESKRATAVADADGKWMAKIGPFAAGGPFVLTVAGSKTETVKDILVGDVWICSGQSNMEFAVAGANNAKQEISQAVHSKLRHFAVTKATANAPADQLNGQWLVCNPATVGSFTAVGYYFGRDLQHEVKVPIGLLHTSWGGTVAEAWTSGEALKALPDFKAVAEQMEKANPGVGNAVPQNGQSNPNAPTVLYNAMIAPLVPFAIKGAIWYQGESNAGRAKQYQTLLPTLIKDWRARFAVGEFPFLIVSLANYMDSRPEPTDSQWAELREAQWLTTQQVPKTGIALAIDIGDAKDIHPKNKQEVGHRLSLAALTIAYGQKVESSGPTFRVLEVKGNAISVKFDHLGGGLVAKNGAKLKGFAIAGSDKKFVWADAKIEGETVLVSSALVKNPTMVRYAWADNPVCNLYNKADLPAVPFRTDN